MVKSTAKGTLTFRIASETREALEAIAVEEDRTLGNVVERILRQAIEARQKKPSGRSR